MPSRVDLNLLPAPPDRVAVRNAKLGRLFEYWNDKRAGRAMPARADIDPLEMREWLGNLLLVEFFGSVERYRVRVDGTNLIAFGGGDRTGKGSESLTSNEERRLVMGQYLPVLEQGQTAYFETEFVNSENRFLREQKLLLPLGNDGVSVNMVLAGIYYQKA